MFFLLKFKDETDKIPRKSKIVRATIKGNTNLIEIKK